jgi:CTP:molybdopterin cytidylyltransferase MocA
MPGSDTRASGSGRAGDREGPAVIQAVVLVGGVGTRLRPLTDSRPKPMVPLVDRPFAAHQIDHLRRHGIADVIFSCGYRPDALEAYFGDGSAMGVRARYVVDPEPLGTAGAIKNAEPLIETDRIVVLNGDILTDLDLTEMLARHRDRGATATIALTHVEDARPYGLVPMDADGRVLEFREKPAELVPGDINAGTYVLEPFALEGWTRGENVSIEIVAWSSSYSRSMTRDTRVTHDARDDPHGSLRASLSASPIAPGISEYSAPSGVVSNSSAAFWRADLSRLFRPWFIPLRVRPCNWRIANSWDTVASHDCGFDDGAADRKIDWRTNSSHLPILSVRQSTNARS